MHSSFNEQRGFTIIEMIVSLGVFSIVITIAVGALLMLVATNQRLQTEQSVMTNLSFALDSMTREIRTGTHYYCDSSGSVNGIFASSYNLDTLGNSYRDCTNGRGNNQIHGIAFNEGGDSISGSNSRILYYFNQNDGKIYRRVGTSVEEPITSTGIFIRDMYFYVAGSKPLSAGNPDYKDQASVTIFIEAAESSNPADDSYYLQTTVTQRTLDL
ncbi:MAG: type II secretion system protein [Candidatus Pacebacteria bacterium]|nr:type II secretion system protein [Candidatus Paceibacterota bacterium]MBP9842663.1 type II secretion system protein [Candidatus Paceibacterota bacterium]